MRDIAGQPERTGCRHRSPSADSSIAAAVVAASVAAAYSAAVLVAVAVALAVAADSAAWLVVAGPILHSVLFLDS